MEKTVEKGLPKTVRLWNRSKLAWSQKVNGEPLTIPAGEFKVMSRRVAVEARGMYLGKDVPVMLEIEAIPDGGFDEPVQDANPQAAKSYPCVYCDEEFSTKEAAKEHMKSHRGGAAMHKKAVKDGSDTESSSN
jgi:hypothetical protein